MSKFNPARGGHATEDIREAFRDAIEGGREFLDPITVDGKAISLKWLTGQLWNCTDILPASECRDLDIPLGSTYAHAAREVRALLSLHSERPA